MVDNSQARESSTDRPTIVNKEILTFIRLSHLQGQQQVTATQLSFNKPNMLIKCSGKNAFLGVSLREGP